MLENIWKVNDLDIYYTDKAIANEAFASDYCNAIKGLYPSRVFKNALEWCSGEGLTGYAMLANGLCDRITFNDFYQPALDTIETTKLKNTKYSDKISIYPGSTLVNIPESEKFDLVVANPPTYLSSYFASKSLEYDKIGRTFSAREAEILIDNRWHARTSFYNEIKKRLAPDGVMLIQENQAGSIQRSDSFNMIIENADLKITGVFNSLEHYHPQTTMQIYYLEVQHR